MLEHQNNPNKYNRSIVSSQKKTTFAAKEISN